MQTNHLIEVLIYLFANCWTFANCCPPSDIKCKTKELIVTLELFYHYKELKTYKNLLVQTKDDLLTPKYGSLPQMTLLSPDSVHSNNWNSLNSIHYDKKYTIDYPALSKKYPSEKEMTLLTINKAIRELDPIISSIRSLLLLILLLPDMIASPDVELLFGVLQKPDAKIHKSQITDVYATVSPRSYTKSPVRLSANGLTELIRPVVSSTPIPVLSSTLQSTASTSTTTIPPPTQKPTTTVIPPSTTILSIPTSRVRKPTPITAKTKRERRKKLRQRRRNRARARKAMNEFKDAIGEYDEVLANYMLMQNFLYGFGR